MITRRRVSPLFTVAQSVTASRNGNLGNRVIAISGLCSANGKCQLVNFADEATIDRVMSRDPQAIAEARDERGQCDKVFG
jgi:hypothetical protein